MKPQTIFRDEWNRYVRAIGERHGYLVCKRITQYGKWTGGMAMYWPCELQPAKLRKRKVKK